jgi:hypothetical protein
MRGCHEITFFASGGQGALFEKIAPWTPTKAFNKFHPSPGEARIMSDCPRFSFSYRLR